MQNFAGVVQVVDANLIAPSAALIGHDLVVKDLSELGHVPRRLVAVLVFVDSIKYSEKVVVRTCDDVTVTESKKITWTKCQITFTMSDQHQTKISHS